MTLEQLQIVFYGVQLVLLLLGGYALGEWGSYIIRQIKAGTLPLKKAQMRFGAAAVVFAFLPFVIVVVFMRLQPFGEVVLFDVADAGTIFTLFGSLLLGFVLQGVALTAFWYFTKAYDVKN